MDIPQATFNRTIIVTPPIADFALAMLPRMRRKLEFARVAADLSNIDIHKATLAQRATNNVRQLRVSELSAVVDQLHALANGHIGDENIGFVDQRAWKIICCFVTEF